MTDLAGMRVLIVEDEYLVALDLAIGLLEAGAQIVGPAGSVDAAFGHIRDTSSLGAAVLDVNLHNDTVFPVADVLAQRGVPFLFTTGYDASSIPERYRNIKRVEKPADFGMILDTLLALKPTSPA